MRVLVDATLPQIPFLFPKPFQCSLYHNAEEVKALIKENDILVCRSTLKVNADLLENSPIKTIATASSGSDHIDKNYLASKAIRLIDARGSNAVSVADYVLSTLAALEQKGIQWKKKAAIIGFGFVGKEVFLHLKKLGFDLCCYDPPLATTTSFQSCSMEDLFNADVLCVHASLDDISPFPSRNLIAEHFLKQLKPQTILINAARGGIVDEEALLRLKPPLYYCTDVYLNEPNINPQVIDFSTLCTPHIAGHSIEAKQKAVEIISLNVHQFFDLNPPDFEKIRKPSDNKLDLKANWQETILKSYDPSLDTKILKQEKGSKESFLKLRTAHNFRHDMDTL